MGNEYWMDLAKAAGIRAIKTIAQTALGMITVGSAISDIDWKIVASVSLVAGIYSLLTSIVSLPEVGEVDDNDDDYEVDEEE